MYQSSRLTNTFFRNLFYVHKFKLGLLRNQKDEIMYHVFAVWLPLAARIWLAAADGVMGNLSGGPLQMEFIHTLPCPVEDLPWAFHRSMSFKWIAHLATLFKNRLLSIALYHILVALTTEDVEISGGSVHWANPHGINTPYNEDIWYVIYRGSVEF